MGDVRDWSGEDTARLIRVPGESDDKYSRGVVGLVTGSSAYPGAAVLSVEAAWRSGAGYVRYVGGGTAAQAVIARRPETVVATSTDGARVGAWVIGSGFATAQGSPQMQAELRRLLTGRTPVVVDAGALDLIDRGERAPAIITPHASEFSRLAQRLGVRPADDAVAAVADMAVRVDAVVLLKGARTLIADSEGAVIRVEAGTGWLATAGTGDVLAGVLGALLAANPAAPLVEVAAAGAWLHGRAGRIAAGMTDSTDVVGHPIVALDVAEALPIAIAGVLA